MEDDSPGTTEEHVEANDVQSKKLSAEDTNEQNVQSTEKIKVCTDPDKTMGIFSPNTKILITEKYDDLRIREIF